MVFFNMELFIQQRNTEPLKRLRKDRSSPGLVILIQNYCEHERQLPLTAVSAQIGSVENTSWKFVITCPLWIPKSHFTLRTATSPALAFGRRLPGEGAGRQVHSPDSRMPSSSRICQTRTAIVLHWMNRHCSSSHWTSSRPS